MSKEQQAVPGLFATESAEDKSEEKKGERRKQFMNLVSADDMKRRTYDTHDELRKEKRWAMFLKKRG